MSDKAEREHPGFLVHAELDGPVIVKHPILLEAVLGRVLSDRGEVFDLRRVPLAREDGVWCAAQSFLIRPVVRCRAPFVRSMKPGVFFPREVLGGAQRVGKVETKRRDTQNLLDDHAAMVASGIVWWGRGDLAHLAEMLQDLREIGAKRAQGYGSLRRVTVTALGPRPPKFGIVHGGAPVRPVPIAWWRSRYPGAPTIEGDIVLGLPRWSAAPEPAALPQTSDMWPDEIQAAIG